MEEPSYFLYVKTVCHVEIEEFSDLDEANYRKRRNEDAYGDSVIACYIVKGWKMSWGRGCGLVEELIKMLEESEKNENKFWWNM